MVTPLNIRHNLYRAPVAVRDPGAAGTITLNIDGGVCSVVTAGAEARTLRQPTKEGITGTVVLDVDGGDLTLTVTGGYNQAGTTAIVFGDAGDFVSFISIKIGANYRWRIVAQEGTNVALTNASTTDATIGNARVTTLNVTNSIQQAQGAPTAVADGNTAITAANLLTKILTMVAGGARAPTVPTGTAMNEILAIGDSIDWSFINLATGANAITVTVATGHTLVGKMTLAQNEQGIFRTRVSAANTAITYRLG
jgi:hypothetical protein